MSFGKETRIEVPLKKGFEITGKVVGPDSQGVPNRFLMLQGVGDKVASVRKTTSCDESGNYRFAGLEAGKYRIVTNFRSANGEGQEVDLEGNARDVTVQVDTEEQ